LKHSEFHLRILFLILKAEIHYTSFPVITSP